MTLFHEPGVADVHGVEWARASIGEVNSLLAVAHYLGPVRHAQLLVGGWLDGALVAAQVWRHPTSRRLPIDGSVVELSRWCLTRPAGANAGSRMHRAAVALVRSHLPRAEVLVSYSDPGAGHTGALYRACNWRWAPTWQRLRPPPSGGGSWDGGVTRQEVKDRWVFPMRRRLSPSVLAAFQVDDAAAVRCYQSTDEYRTVTSRWPPLLPLFGPGPVVSPDGPEVQPLLRPPAGPQSEPESRFVADVWDDEDSEDDELPVSWFRPVVDVPTGGRL